MHACEGSSIASNIMQEKSKVGAFIFSLQQIRIIHSFFLLRWSERQKIHHLLRHHKSQLWSQARAGGYRVRLFLPLYYHHHQYHHYHYHQLHHHHHHRHHHHHYHHHNHHHHHHHHHRHHHHHHYHVNHHVLLLLLLFLFLFIILSSFILRELSR